MEQKKIITIARQYASGGTEIARKLAKELGIHFYDKEILHMAAKETGIRESYFYLADESRSNTLIERIAKGLKRKTIEDDMFSPDNLFRFQSQMIEELADRESCVIVGRLADYVLAGRSDLISVYIHSDLDYRIAYAVQNRNLSEAEARVLIEKRDRERADYCKHYSGRVWGDANAYTISLNAGAIGEDKAVALIKGLFQDN